MRKMFLNKNGFVLLYKPAGITSFKVLNIIKSVLKTKKIGHIGTLDKFAEGLIGVLTGCYTKLVPYFVGFDKEYLAEIYFGKKTDTLDPEGEVVETKDIPDINTLKEVLKGFEGEIEQVPPLYSAVHHNGTRAYKLARTGARPELSARKVTIRKMDFLKWEPPLLKLNISCSKGTYIRALARDIGEKCNSCAYVNSLKRTAIGPFSIKDSVKPEDFDPEKDLLLPYNFIKQIDKFYKSRIKENKLNKLLNGSPIKDDFFLECPEKDGNIAVFDSLNRLIAIIVKEKGKYRYNTVFNI